MDQSVEFPFISPFYPSFQSVFFISQSNCAKSESEKEEDSPCEKTNQTELYIIIAVLSVLLVAVICFSVIRSRRIQKNDVEVVDENVKDDSGEEEEAVVTRNEHYWKFSDHEDYYEHKNNVITDTNDYYYNYNG